MCVGERFPGEDPHHKPLHSEVLFSSHSEYVRNKFDSRQHPDQYTCWQWPEIEYFNVEHSTQINVFRQKKCFHKIL